MKTLVLATCACAGASWAPRPAARAGARRGDDARGGGRGRGAPGLCAEHPVADGAGDEVNLAVAVDAARRCKQFGEVERVRPARRRRAPPRPASSRSPKRRRRAPRQGRAASVRPAPTCAAGARAARGGGAAAAARAAPSPRAALFAARRATRADDVARARARGGARAAQGVRDDQRVGARRRRAARGRAARRDARGRAPELAPDVFALASALLACKNARDGDAAPSCSVTRARAGPTPNAVCYNTAIAGAAARATRARARAARRDEAKARPAARRPTRSATRRHAACHDGGDWEPRARCSPRCASSARARAQRGELQHRARRAARRGPAEDALGARRDARARAGAGRDPFNIAIAAASRRARPRRSRCATRCARGVAPNALTHTCSSQRRARGAPDARARSRARCARASSRSTAGRSAGRAARAAPRRPPRPRARVTRSTRGSSARATARPSRSARRAGQPSSLHEYSMAISVGRRLPERAVALLDEMRARGPRRTSSASARRSRRAARRASGSKRSRCSTRCARTGSSPT